MTRFGAFCIFLLVSVLLAGCGGRMRLDVPLMPRDGLSDEEKIAFILNDVCLGMESRRIYKVLAHVSPGYRDQEGRDYAAIQEYLSEIVKEFSDVKITRMRPLILVQGNQARALETFGTVARPKDPRKMAPLNLQGQVYVYFERVGGAWKIVEWSPLL